jgi:hypothetical protein
MQQVEEFEHINMVNMTTQSNNSKMKWKNKTNANPR